MKLKETLLARDSDVSEKDKYLTLVDQVKDRCVKYLNRPLAFRDIPDVVSLSIKINFSCDLHYGMVL